MNSTKKINVTIPAEIQHSIDAGDYTINGSLVRDKLGRIVCHLDSLEAEEEQYFSPSIFVSINNCAIISVSTVSIQLQNELREIRAARTSVNRKLDRLLANQANALISSITNFEEHFNSLLAGSSLTNEKETFAAGTKAASELAVHIPNYIKDYLGEIRVYHRNANYNGEKYSDYLERDSKYLPNLDRSEFLNFSDSEARYFFYAFINIINNINIISLCFDFAIYPRYEENLRQVRDLAVDLLIKVIEGLKGEGDIFEMCYTVNHQNRYHRIKNIESLLKYVDFSIHDLILRKFADKPYRYDENRVKSMYEILRIIDNIDNLLKRKEILSSLDLNGLPELSQIKKITFEEK